MVKNYYQYITLSEALELGRYQLSGDISRAFEIYNAALRRNLSQLGDPHKFLAIGTVFHAGYIAGMRAEREKLHSTHSREVTKQ